jgi:succinyl-CoA synthetase alpha subunit
MSILLDGETRVMIQGITGKQARTHTKYMLAYGTQIVCGVTPGRGGTEVEGVPVYDTVEQALQHHEVDLTVLFLSAYRVRDAALEAITHRIPTMIILEDGVPYHDAAEILARGKQLGIRIIGPNCQGLVSPGKAKVGGSGGSVPERVFSPGSVGIISRSGGMGIESCIQIKNAGLGQSTYVPVGGDLMIGTSPKEVLALFQEDPQTEVVFYFGEMGSCFEEELAEFIAAGGCTKPVVAYIAGENLEKLPRTMSFGHTRSLASQGEGSVADKKAALRLAGVRVADHLNEIVPLIEMALKSTQRSVAQ